MIYLEQIKESIERLFKGGTRREALELAKIHESGNRIHTDFWLSASQQETHNSTEKLRLAREKYYKSTDESINQVKRLSMETPEMTPDQKQ